MTQLCLECGKPLESVKRSSQLHCSRECRNTFNNRRLQRGAILYDLFMANRYQRTLAKEIKVWGKICRAVITWREEDKAKRDGRNSWLDPRQVLQRDPSLTGVKGKW